jgi:hypothetical protein
MRGAQRPAGNRSRRVVQTPRQPLRCGRRHAASPEHRWDGENLEGQAGEVNQAWRQWTATAFWHPRLIVGPQSAPSTSPPVIGIDIERIDADLRGCVAACGAYIERGR